VLIRISIGRVQEAVASRMVGGSATPAARRAPAMADLFDLFSSNKQLTWCRKWLSDIGHEETNPATLTMFALCIGNHTKHVRELVRDLRKQGFIA
jgi:hypothetical protein